MPRVHVQAASIINAPQSTLYAILADYRNCHPRILPRKYFSDLVVEQGGMGEGTIIAFMMTLGGKARRARMTVSEPTPGSVLQERDPASDTTTTFTVEAMDHDTSRVTIHTTWTRRGLRGLIERMVAPAMLRKVYVEELENLRVMAERLGTT